MAPIITFFNQKGGTAKTTSTLNVAAALAELGFNVLAMDLDPQASLTMAFGIDIREIDHSVYDLLTDDAVAVEQITLPTGIDRVTIAPSHPDLAAAELELVNELERERRLASKLSVERDGDFDIVLIDAPPALNVISINILVAATGLIIPIEPHPLSLMVLHRLFDTVNRVRRLNPGLEIIGFLPTKVHHSSRLAADMIDTLHDQFPGIQVMTPVPLSVKGAESIIEHTSILEYMPTSPLSQAYRDAAQTLIESIELREGRVAGV